MNQLILNLKAAFGECKRNHSSICPSGTSFEIIDSRKFFVFDDRMDDANPVKIVDSDSSYQLTVENKNNTPICLIKTDKCLFTDEHKKCDCILFNTEKYFFVEISDAKNKAVKRRKAVKQLAITLELYKQSNIDLTMHDLKAIICFRNGQTRPTQPSRNTMRAIFLEDHNVSLEEGNLISF